MRRCYLIAYDIADDKRRTSLYKSLLDRADHVQYSVFIAELDKREYARVRSQLSSIINHDKDQVIFLDLGPATVGLAQGRRLECLGIPYCPAQRTMIV